MKRREILLSLMAATAAAVPARARRGPRSLLRVPPRLSAHAGLEQVFDRVYDEGFGALEMSTQADSSNAEKSH